VDAREQARDGGVDRVNTRAAAWIARSVSAVNLSVLAVALFLILAGWIAGSATEGTPWWEQAVGVFGLVGAPILGGLIASRRPGNPYGWLWLGYGMGFALSSLADAYIAYTEAVDSVPIPVSWPIHLLSPLGWAASVILVPFMLLLFPDGRLPSARWRFVAWTYVVAIAVILVLVPFRADIAQSPFDILGPVGEAIVAITSAGAYVVFAAIVVSALSLVSRYRQSAGVQRQQLKWLAYAATLVGVWIIGDVLFLSGFTLNIFGTVAFSGLYVGVGIAILRYRLYDIDRIINRTLVYGSLTTMLALAYFGGVAATQAIFGGLIGQEEFPQLAIVISTLVIAALFSPLRRRIQAFIDRRFYRRKYDARKTLETFSSRLRDETDLDVLSNDLTDAVRETMQPAHVSLWLRPETRVRERWGGEQGRETT
jgi:hypothetical protein